MSIDVFSTLIATLAAATAALAGVVLAWRQFRGVGDSTAELEEAVARRLSDDAHVPDPASRQYLLLREYHAQGLTQSKVSFWFSIVLATVGFLVIVSAIMLAMAAGGTGDQSRSWITLVAGTIVEALSALIFVQTNKSRQLMTQFFDKLREDRKLDEALVLTDRIADPVAAGHLRTVLAMHFVSTSWSPTVIPGFQLNQNGSSQPQDVAITSAPEGDDKKRHQDVSGSTPRGEVVDPSHRR